MSYSYHDLWIIAERDKIAHRIIDPFYGLTLWQRIMARVRYFLFSVGG
jgi:hypothetical protein